MADISAHMQTLCDAGTHTWSCHLFLYRYTHLRRDAAPEVGVRPRGVQHGSDDRLVLRYQQVEGVGVGEDVVRVGELEQKKRDKQEQE